LAGAGKATGWRPLRSPRS